MASSRLDYVDLFRGLLVAHMALDHASMMFNAHRWGEELAAQQPPPPVDFGQFLTRFSGVPVAPGFIFMAGFMVALTSHGREARGVPSGEVTRRLVIRGLVLLLVDQTIMSLPRIAMGFVSFNVLSCIGVSLILLAWLRNVRTAYLLAGSLAVLFLHPVFDLSALPAVVRGLVYEPMREGAFRSLYPVLPWAGVMFAGFVAGRDATTRESPARAWLTLAAVSFAAFFAVRLANGYGNAYPHHGPGQLDFWFFAKYPPDLPWLTWAFGWIFLGLAGLRALAREGVPRLLAPFVILGRVSFFFYIIHFFAFGITMAILRTKLDLPAVFAVWIVVTGLLVWPCAWYYEKKRARPNWFTRYV
jgi:uncharacterized membrane protein